jgi:ElaB/YqjD/DUF883 family membrane-anchored ribosome-binding protein
MASSAKYVSRILDSWEAAMATITFNAADRNEQVREQIKTALDAYHKMLDAFADNQTRQAAEQAELARPRHIPGTTSPSKNTP